MKKGKQRKKLRDERWRKIIKESNRGKNVEMLKIENEIENKMQD